MLLILRIMLLTLTFLFNINSYLLEFNLKARKDFYFNRIDIDSLGDVMVVSENVCCGLSSPGSVYIYARNNDSSYERTQILQATSPELRSLKISQDGSLIFLGYHETTPQNLQIYLNTNKTYTLHQSLQISQKITTLTLSTDKSTLIVITDSNTPIILKINPSTTLYTIFQNITINNSQKIGTVDVSSDGLHINFGGENQNAVYLYQFDGVGYYAGEAYGGYIGMSVNSVGNVAISADGQLFAFQQTSEGTQIYHKTPQTNKKIPQIDKKSNPLSKISLTFIQKTLYEYNTIQQLLLIYNITQTVSIIKTHVFSFSHIPFQFILAQDASLVALVTTQYAQIYVEGEVVEDEEVDEGQVSVFVWVVVGVVGATVSGAAVVGVWLVFFRNKAPANKISEKNNNPHSLRQLYKSNLSTKQPFESSCSICFESQNQNISLKCGHNFHFNCISQWIKNKHTCPNCRSQMKQSSKISFWCDNCGSKIRGSTFKELQKYKRRSKGLCQFCRES